MTALGLLVAGIQTWKVRRLRERSRDQLTLYIGDANYVSFEHEILDALAARLDDPQIMRFLVSSHQRGCDLYRSLVVEFLAQERSFTFDDLRKLCDTPLITYRWQEEFWRERTILRPENRNVPVPVERFLAENKQPRFKTLPPAA